MLSLFWILQKKIHFLINMKRLGLTFKEIYESIDLTREEISYIDKLFDELKPITTRKQSQTAKAKKGGSRKPHRVTRKIRRS